MKKMLTPKCDICGHRYPINPNDIIPAMVGFQSFDGTITNCCRKCIIEIGKSSKK